MEGVDQLLTDYQIKDGHIIMQLNSVSSTSHQSPFPITIQNLQAKMLNLFSPIISSNLEFVRFLPMSSFVFDSGYLNFFKLGFWVLLLSWYMNTTDQVINSTLKFLQRTTLPSLHYSLHPSFLEKLTYPPHFFNPPRINFSIYILITFCNPVTLHCNYLFVCLSHQTQTECFHSCAPSI